MPAGPTTIARAWLKMSCPGSPDSCVFKPPVIHDAEVSTPLGWEGFLVTCPPCDPQLLAGVWAAACRRSSGVASVQALLGQPMNEGS